MEIKKKFVIIKLKALTRWVLFFTLTDKIYELVN